MRHAALEKGIILTNARSEQSHHAAIRAETRRNAHSERQIGTSETHKQTIAERL
jgi:hypothetical protein